MGNTAERIKLIRDAKGLSQSALARFGVSQKNISEWENGTNADTFQKLAIIAREWEVSGDYLLGLTDDPAPVPRRKINEQDRELLDIARQLPEHRRRELAEFTQTMLESEKRSKKNRQVVARVMDWIEAIAGEQGLQEAIESAPGVTGIGGKRTSGKISIAGEDDRSLVSISGDGTIVLLDRAGQPLLTLSASTGEVFFTGNLEQITEKPEEMP